MLVAQTLINTLLAFDAYFKWYYPLVDSVPFMCPYEQREERAFSNMRSAIHMKEQFERVSINNHKSFLPHLAVYKVRYSASSITISFQLAKKNVQSSSSFFAS